MIVNYLIFYVTIQNFKTYYELVCFFTIYKKNSKKELRSPIKNSRHLLTQNDKMGKYIKGYPKM